MKKIALAMVAATAVFASNAAYNYEITPTIGGVHPEGNLRVKDHNFVGIRAARNLEDFFCFRGKHRNLEKPFER